MTAARVSHYRVNGKLGVGGWGGSMTLKTSVAAAGRAEVSV
jgi:hypothetical protein